MYVHYNNGWGSSSRENARLDLERKREMETRGVSEEKKWE